MEEWQNRLRAQKQQDRNNKNKSAELLHSYQAKDEDDAQKKIRENRRESLLKKNEAKELLANYRPDAANIEALTPSKANQSSKFDNDGPLPPAVSAPTKDDPRTAIAAGAVSSIAANFTGSGTPINMSATSKPENVAKSHNVTAATAQNATEHNNNNFSFTEIGSKDIEKAQATDMNQEWVQVTSDEIAIPGAGGPQMTTGAARTPTAGGPNSKQAETAVTATGNAQQPTSNRNQLVQSAIMQSQPPAMATSQQPTMASVLQPEAPQYSRLDVDFSFGLISTRAQPSMDAYMQGVQEILLVALDENPEMQLLLSYNSLCPPFVGGIKKDGKFCGCKSVLSTSRWPSFHLDSHLKIMILVPVRTGYCIVFVESFVDPDGRGNVQRLMVKAKVPVFIANNITSKKARSFVIKALGAALRQGYFLRIAEGA